MKKQDNPACPDVSRIVDACAALDGDPIEALTHVEECDRCRVVVETLSALHRLRTDGPGTTDSVEHLADRVSARLLAADQVDLRLLPTDRLAPAPGRFWPRWGLVAANWAGAVMAGFWGVLLMSSGTTVAIGPGGAAVAAVLAGFIPLASELRTRPPRPASTPR